eukprot:39309-Amphidinium_carterae.3
MNLCLRKSKIGKGVFQTLMESAMMISRRNFSGMQMEEHAEGWLSPGRQAWPGPRRRFQDSMGDVSWKEHGAGGALFTVPYDTYEPYSQEEDSKAVGSSFSPGVED